MSNSINNLQYFYPNLLISQGNTGCNLKTLHEKLLANDSELLANDSEIEQIKKIFKEVIEVYESSLWTFESYNREIKTFGIQIKRILYPQNLIFPNDIMKVILNNLNVKTLYRLSITSCIKKEIVDQEIRKRAELMKPKWKDLDFQIAWKFHKNLHHFQKLCGIQIGIDQPLEFVAERLKILTVDDVIKIFSKRTIYLYIKYLKFDAIPAQLQINFKESDNAVKTATKWGSVKILKLLQKSNVVFSSDLMGIAAQEGYLKVVKFLESIGMLIDVKGFGGVKPLEYAVESKNNHQVVEFLLECGARPLNKKKFDLSEEYKDLMSRYRIYFVADEAKRRNIITHAKKLGITPVDYFHKYIAARLGTKDPQFSMKLDLLTMQKIIVVASRRNMSPSDYISSLIIKDENDYPLLYENIDIPK